MKVQGLPSAKSREHRTASNQSRSNFHARFSFLTSGPGYLRYAREFARKRRVERSESKMNQLYAVGHAHKHRRIDVCLLQLCDVEGLGARSPANWIDSVCSRPTASVHHLISPLYRDLKQYPGATLVVAGDQQPAVVICFSSPP